MTTEAPKIPKRESHGPTPPLKYGGRQLTATPIEPKPILSDEEKREKAIEALKSMCLEDDDMAIVVVTSPYRRLDNVCYFIDGTSSYSLEDNIDSLKQEINGTEVWRVLLQIMQPIFELLDERNEVRLEDARRESYQRGREDEFKRICNVLKGER